MATDMLKIIKIAKKYKLKVISDTQSIGSTYKDKYAEYFQI